ncbi:hypothetical protein H8L32_05520 [Undibacterium sp. CY18W]|uniref:Uncharacterized protein n=1 Tax=Undibacterium hunanense TaxID=2762292 RepID=A0ABR6ZMA7_9BURK|nr:hypothetical protein [Undibacterium hunanense]MBC3916929.1 hypothetical protein [Undibacterium hunanense]
MYEVEIIRFQPVHIKQEFSFSSAVEATKVALELDDETSFIVIADIRGNACWGEFLVWRSEGRALVRLNEHREHFASYRDISAIQTSDVSFLDDDGSVFDIPLANTVSVESAKEALLHWLLTGEATIALLWS